MKSIIVKVNINEGGNAELFRALQSVPKEMRAERLRTLAFAGLLSAQGRIVAVPSAALPEPQPGPESGAETHGKFNSFRKTLGVQPKAPG